MKKGSIVKSIVIVGTVTILLLLEMGFCGLLTFIIDLGYYLLTNHHFSSHIKEFIFLVSNIIIFVFLTLRFLNQNFDDWDF